MKESQSSCDPLERFGIKLDGTNDLIKHLEGDPHTLVLLLLHFRHVPRFFGTAVLIAASEPKIRKQLEKKLGLRGDRKEMFQKLLAFGNDAYQSDRQAGRTHDEIMSTAKRLLKGHEQLEAFTGLILLLSVIFSALRRDDLLSAPSELPSRVAGSVADASLAAIDCLYRTTALIQVLALYKELCLVDRSMGEQVSEALTVLSRKVAGSRAFCENLRKYGPLAPGGYFTHYGVTAESMTELVFELAKRLLFETVKQVDPLATLTFAMHESPWRFTLPAGQKVDEIQAMAKAFPVPDVTACLGGIRAEALRLATDNFTTLPVVPKTDADSEKLEKAWQFIIAKGKVKGVLIASHIGVKYPTFRKHYAPVLIARGAKTTGDGYFV